MCDGCGAFRLPITDVVQLVLYLLCHLGVVGIELKFFLLFRTYIHVLLVNYLPI
jgi:hypothetical protein